MYFLGKVKHRNFKLVYNNNGKVPHFFTWKILPTTQSGFPLKFAQQVSNKIRYSP